MHRFIFVSLFVALCACSSTPASTDISPMLDDMTRVVILPAMSDLESKGNDLANASETYAATGDAASLTAAQNAWRACRRAWKKVDPFRFGPIDAKSVPAAIDFPTNVDALERALAADDTTDAAIENLGGSARGFFAMEFLLFDVPPSMGASEAPKARREFVYGLSRHVQKKLREVNAAWGATEHFADDVLNAGKGSATFPSQQAVVAQLVNQSLFAIETVVDAKLGRPLGKKTGKGIEPGAEETRRSDNTLAESIALWESVERLYGGSTGTLGVTSVLRAKNPEVASRFESQLAEAEAKLSGLKTPFATTLAADTASVEAAYVATKLAKTTASVEVASTLGIAITFNSNDGD